MELAAKMAPLERQKYYRSFGQLEKTGIHTAVVGKHAKVKGLYYDPDLPFIESYKYFRKPSITQRTQAKEKGHNIADEYSETRSRFIHPADEDPFVMAGYTEKVPGVKANYGVVHKYKKVRKSEAVWDETSRKWRLPIPKTSINHPERKGRIQEIVDDIISSPSKYGLKPDPTIAIKIPYKAYTNAVNKIMSKEGFGKIPHNSVKEALVARQGTSLARFSGTEAEKKMHKFLKTIDPDTKKPYYETITNPELQKLPYLKGLDETVIVTSRQRAGLTRTNIGKSDADKKEPRLQEAERKLKQKIKKKYSYLSDDEVEALGEQGSIAFDAVEHGFRAGYKKRYPDKTIDAVFNFIEDTEILNRGKDPYYTSYIMERALNRLRTALSGQTHTMGHARKEAKDSWWFPGYETPTISPQKWDDNLRQHGVDVSFQSAIKRGDMDTALKEYKKMLKMGMRSSMVDEFGEQIFYGSPPIKGKMADGGLVNGYSRGGSVKKLLDDALGMMSRRKFLKGMGATAASAAMPRSAMKLAAPAAKKAAMSFAPPWVNGMLSALKGVKTWSPTLDHTVGNNASLIKIGSKKLKVFKDQDANISYFKVKTSDYKMADESAVKKGEKHGDSWDDVELREEPGQTTITWKNKNYDHGNDQHIVIDKKNKETRFVDDNWHMEAGGEDIAYDDWIEYPLATNKNKIAESLKKQVSEIDDAIVDGNSVNDMDNDYADMFRSYVDSFSPAGNIFGTVERMLKKITKSDLLKKEKIYNDEQVRNLKEKDMLDWEDQFRGGQGIHGYNGGGSVDFLRGRKDDEIMARMMVAEQDRNFNDARKIAHVINNRAPYANRGTFSAHPDRSLSNVARIVSGPNQFTPFHSNVNKRFYSNLTDRDYPQDYYLRSLEYARNVLGGSEIDPTGGATFFDKDPKRYLGNEDYTPAWDINNPNTMRNTGHYFWKYNPAKMADGGIARRPNAVPPEKGPDPYASFISDSAAQVMNNPSEFMGTQFIQKFAKGGYVKKLAPKVLGKITNYKPKLTMSEVLKNAQKAKKQTAGQKIIEEVKMEEPGAMFWGSREKIIGAPSEAMTAKQWLTYMKLGKHGILNPKGYPIIKDMELNDTSLAPWLSRMGNKTVSKDSLVKQFDEMAPEMEVVSLGETTGGRIFDDMSRNLKKIDTQAIRNPAIKGFYDYVKAVLPQLKEKPTGKEADEIAKNIDEMVYRNFGVQNALEEGVPQRFPFEVKELLQSMSTGLGKRTAGFKKYKRTPQHRGTQMMEGGDNYREFLFKYKPGSLRQNEPEYKYAHDFNLEHSDRVGGIVHTRTSDRADQFGRRLLHIEEIQSDMHQKINMAQRQLKRMHAKWAQEGKTPKGEYAKMSKQKKKDYDEIVAEGKYAPRGDLKEEIGTANEQHLLLVKAKIEDLLSQKQTAAIKTRINRLNKEREKVRKMIDEEKAKMAQGDNSGIPQGPLSKTEDYNEFVMKYLLRVAREGGYDGISINTAAIKNKGLSITGRDYKGNLVAYGPMAKGAMEKAAKKSGAKFMKTYIMDGNKKVWEVPMILFKENRVAKELIDKGLPIYKRGGIVKK